MPRATSRTPEALPPRMLCAASALLLPVALLEGAEELPVPAGAVDDAELVTPKPVFETDGPALVERGVPDEAAELDALVDEADLDDGMELAPLTVVDRVADSAPMAKSSLVENTSLRLSMATNSRA